MCHTYAFPQPKPKQSRAHTHVFVVLLKNHSKMKRPHSNADNVEDIHSRFKPRVASLQCERRATSGWEATKSNFKCTVVIYCASSGRHH